MIPILVAVVMGAFLVAVALSFVDFERHQPKRTEKPRPDIQETQAALHQFGAASLGVHQTAVQLADELGLELPDVDES